jgi:nucleotide-binding universal stress UspA family protein
MRSYLVVANQTLGGEQFSAAVKERIALDECMFHVVVPATAVDDQLVAYGGETGPTKTPSAGEHAHAIAQQRLAAAVQLIKAAGGQADGEVGDPDPLAAVREMLGRLEVDEIIISTLPLRLSRWLRRDIPRQVERLSQLPVTHIIGTDPAR